MIYEKGESSIKQIEPKLARLEIYTSAEDYTLIPYSLKYWTHAASYKYNVLAFHLNLTAQLTSSSMLQFFTFPFYSHF